jgi:hypothetical protein
VQNGLIWVRTQISRVAFEVAPDSAVGARPFSRAHAGDGYRMLHSCPRLAGWHLKAVKSIGRDSKRPIG